MSTSTTGWLSRGGAPTAAAKGGGAGGFVCENVSLSFPTGTGHTRLVLGPLDLSIAPGQFVSLIGGSGVGKTSLLRVLGGLHRPDPTSHVSYGGQGVSGPPAGVVTVFQDYASSLLPWRTAQQNIELGIEQTCDKKERRERAREALEMIGLTRYASSYPWQLSGGQQQRVQIARAVVTRPTALMMDEPFGALDAMTKASLQDSLLRIHAETRTTVVFVTHDIDEAVYLGDRVIMLAGSPGAVAVDAEITLPRPRHQVTTKEAPEYLRIRHLLYSALRESHENAS
ncbi:ABC transporter ATP-binding protein [Streptomyces sp. NPDC050560]|uniref:ABC transporter ATP-binding protein n=1 Tax=Streptomyces sp. NPDC050560 TaxID=3365630 RepID=UPI0037BAF037